MKVRIIRPSIMKPAREISKTVEGELKRALGSMKTPYWPTIGMPPIGIKRPPFDVPQAWINHILAKQLLKMNYSDEVNPFSATRPTSVLPRTVNGTEQAIDFERVIRSSGKRHVIEVECGNVASLYRSIHKICMAMREKNDTVGILVTPDQKLIGRCDTTASMSNSKIAKILLSEISFYHKEASQIFVIEFSTDQTVDLRKLNSTSGFWGGNWNDAHEQFLNANLNSFLK